MSYKLIKHEEKKYHNLKDIIERGEDLFICYGGRGQGKTYFRYTIEGMQRMLNEYHNAIGRVDFKASKDISKSQIDKYVITEKDKRDFFNTVLNFYEKMFEYTIDGKEVSAREFFNYVNKLNLSSAYGTMVDK